MKIIGQHKNILTRQYKNGKKYNKIISYKFGKAKVAKKKLYNEKNTIKN